MLLKIIISSQVFKKNYFPMFIYLMDTFHLHISDRKSHESILKLQVASLKNQESMSLTLPLCICELQFLDLQVLCFSHLNARLPSAKDCKNQ